MAEEESEKALQLKKTFRYSKDTDRLLRGHLTKILDSSKSNNANFRDKLDQIDYAYARYLTAKEAKDLEGQNHYGKTACNTEFSPIVSPIVISQVQSMVAYLAEVYLSGYPIFPVVSLPQLRNEAEALEGIVQDHLNMSQSIPAMQLMFNYAARYNLFAYDIEWTPITSYNPTKGVTDLAPDQNTMKIDHKHINKIKAPNLRNTHWDQTVRIEEVAEHGAFAGYTEIWNRVRLKNFLNYLSDENKLSYRQAVKQALESNFSAEDWNEDPLISSYINQSSAASPNWDQFGGFIEELPEGLRQVPKNAEGVYAVTKLYLRILPSDFLMTDVPNKNRVQIWVAYIVNRQVVISMEPYVGPNNMFGMGLSLLIEDGMELQTQSFGEMAMPLQTGVTRLMNIRFQTAKRALQDRGLYNPAMIRASDINSPFMGSKIPVIPNALMNGTMDNAYKHIPFDARGTEGVLQDAMMITDWQRELSGQNNASRGQFTKGNRTLGEFDSIMGNAENRQRLPALVVEHRAMAHIKASIKLNILQFGQDTEVVSPRTGEVLQVSIEKLQQLNLQFEIGDGYTPKSKMANTEFLMAGMQMITQSQLLAQSFGSQLPAIFAHAMTLGGVRGFDGYAAAAIPEFQKNLDLQQQMAALVQQLQQQVASGQAGAVAANPAQQEGAQ